MRNLTPAPGPITPLEVGLLVSATVLNSAVTFAGFVLWRAGSITMTASFGPTTVVEFLGLVLVMDALMYLTHGIAHLRPLFPLAHRLHHTFADARPITLFALHPLEVIGFGAMWLVVLAVYPISVWALGAYAALNLVFGILGHLGVEPLPASVRRHGLFRWIATPTMHAGHHVDPRVNRGFYTTVWDRLFGTLDPAYDARRTAAVPPAYTGAR